MKKEKAEGGKVLEIDGSRYYGVAWNFIQDTYRVTGLLKAAKKYEDAEGIMFIHNSIKRQPDGSYKMPKIYSRKTKTETEIIFEISDLPLSGFSFVDTNHEWLSYEGVIPTAILILFEMDYGVYILFHQRKKSGG